MAEPRPRICHVNLARGFRGGERQTELLIRELADAGLRQWLLCRAGEPLPERLEGVPGLALQPLRRPFLRYVFTRPCFDLVHVHEGRSVVLAYILSLRTGVPYVVTRRVPNPLSGRAMTRKAYRRASRVVAISGAIQNGLSDYDSRLRPVTIPSATSGLAVDAAAAERLHRRYRGRFVVGHVGALVDRHKGQSVLIEAARRLRDAAPDMHFVLLGDGRDREWLRARASGLNNVEFVGFVENVGDYLATFNVFAFPSFEEGLGSVLLDAMSFRVPVVASRVDGIPDIVEHGNTGLLVQPGDPDALADALLCLYRDRGLRERVAEAGARVADAHGPAVMAERYLDLYEKVLSGDGRPNAAINSTD